MRAGEVEAGRLAGPRRLKGAGCPRDPKEERARRHVAGERRCHKPLPPQLCVCRGGRGGGAQGSPGPGRFVLQDSGDSAPCKPLCRVLPVGVRTLGHRDSEASAPSIFSLRYWSPPEWGGEEKAVGSNPADRQPRFAIRAPGSNSPTPSGASPLAPSPSPGIQLGQSHRKKLAAPRQVAAPTLRA